MSSDYISPGNDKTECSSFDLPAKFTCPGMTASCASKCYAAKLMVVYPNVGRKYERNFEFSRTAGFVAHMVANIPFSSQFRIHVSGDFYSAEYVAKWREIATRRPDVQFYAYTRSWRIEEIWDSVMALNALPNVNVNLSVDKDTGKPEVPYADDYRWAYLSHDDSAPEWLRSFDIVFRSNHSAQPGQHQWKRNKATKLGQDPDVVAPLMHRIVGTVCPMERGRKMPSGFSCAKCRLCVNKPTHEKVGA